MVETINRVAVVMVNMDREAILLMAAAAGAGAGVGGDRWTKTASLIP